MVVAVVELTIMRIPHLPPVTVRGQEEVVGSVVVEWGLQHGPIRVIPYTILPHVGPAQMDWTEKEVVVVVRGHSLLD